jgi:hypothetical protein
MEHTMRTLFGPAMLSVITTLLLAPSAVAQEKAGVVTTLEGNVTVTRVTLAPRPLKFKDDVFLNDKVTTGDRALARMLLGGKAVVTVRERSSLTITEAPGKATIDLDSGKIALAVAKERMRPGESIEIRAANVVAGVRGTVVIAEVASAAVSLEQPGLVGILHVLKGQIDARLVSPGSAAVSVGPFQRFSGGTVAAFLPADLPVILRGLSPGQLPAASGNDGQAKETALNSGIAALGAFTGIGSGGTNVPPTQPTVVGTTAPIQPGNCSACLVKPTPPPAMPPPTTCHGGYGYGYGHGG